jgi:hypothetical protein
MTLEIFQIDEDQVQFLGFKIFPGPSCSLDYFVIPKEKIFETYLSSRTDLRQKSLVIFKIDEDQVQFLDFKVLPGLS